MVRKWRHQGSGDSGVVHLNVYRSADADISASDTLIYQFALPSVVAGDTRSTVLRLTAPSLAGTYYYGACVTDTTVAETRTDNNCSSGVRITVAGADVADLVVEALRVDDNTVTVDQAFTLTATVRNQGTGVAGATNIRLYRSVSTLSWYEPDNEVGSGSVPSLVASDTRSFTFNQQAPSTPGTYYYGACVGSVVEEDTGNKLNNCSNTVEVTVTDTDASGDRAVLEALYDATGGPNWIVRTNWLTDAALEDWFGVSADGGGRVTELRLPGNGLRGPIPTELGGLDLLQVLDLGSRRDDVTGQAVENALSGPIPSELGRLTGLRSLVLGGNTLNGPIPPELGNLTGLNVLDLGGNNLAGGQIPGWLIDLTGLVVLNLMESQLAGPVPAWLGDLINLRQLYLNANNLTGHIPVELGKLANLQYLYLFENDLIGSIPRELGSLANLRALLLYDNALTGSIPPELGRLANVRYLYLQSNQLRGPIPPEVGDLNELARLFLSYNALTGPIPPELGNLTNLERMTLNANALSGPLPSSLTRLSQLDVLWIHLTRVCAPADATFQVWVQAIDDFHGAICGRDGPWQFGDSTLAQGQTVVKAFHLRQLRWSVNMLRTYCELRRNDWSDPVIQPGVTPIRAVHVTELRAALRDAYEACALTPRPAYTDPRIARGVTPIKAVHFTELREEVVRGLEAVVSR